MICKLKQRLRKAGFTLMEVNLAIMIMATGVLAMVSLYPLGYRENQQGRDDVWSASEADRIFNQLHASLSERAIKWDDWVGKLKTLESSVGSWALYCEENAGWVPKKKGQINSLAQNALNALSQIPRVRPTDLALNNDRTYAIVVRPGSFRHNGLMINDYSRVTVCMRISRKPGMIFSQPVYYTEIRFQGDQEKQ